MWQRFCEWNIKPKPTFENRSFVESHYSAYKPENCIMEYWLYSVYISLCDNIHKLFYCSSSSCRAASTDLPDPLSPPVSIVHCSQEVFKALSCIGTDLLYIGSSWWSCLCSSMWRGQQEYVTYEFVLTSPAMSCMSAASNFYSFRDWWMVAVQLLLCGVLPPGLV